MSKTITYTGWAYDQAGDDIYIDGVFPVEDEQRAEPSVGIFSGCVWIDHPEHDIVEIPDVNVKEYYREYSEDY